MRTFLIFPKFHFPNTVMFVLYIGQNNIINNLTYWATLSSKTLLSSAVIFLPILPLTHYSSILWTVNEKANVKCRNQQQTNKSTNNLTKWLLNKFIFLSFVFGIFTLHSLYIIYVHHLYHHRHHHHHLCRKIMDNGLCVKIFVNDFLWPPLLVCLRSLSIMLSAFWR